jgi:hypothetical protein
MGGFMNQRRFVALASATALLGVAVLGGASRSAPAGRFDYRAKAGVNPPLSGPADPRFLNSNGGVSGAEAAASAAAAGAAAVPGARRGDDYQVNADNKRNPVAQFGSGEGWPANETAIAVNPTDPTNVIAGANDYESGVDSVMGLYASFNGGKTWPYSRHTRQVITPDRQMYGTGDPVIAFDSEGTAYASFIAFGRANCDSYVSVIRSSDKGVTWSTPVASQSEGTKLQLGDGIVIHNRGPEDCGIFHDKEWMTAGPRPAGAALVPGTNRRFLSPDRLYVTWTRFNFGPNADTFVDAPIYIAYSDDQGRHWSKRKEISGSAPFCDVQFGDADGNRCDEDQFSVPVVDPRNGRLYVAFENFNNTGTVKNQYLVVRSNDGGGTFSRPVRVADVFDGINKYPVCEGSQTLDEMCARVNAAGNIDVDPRNGNLYLTWADNRQGTAENTNVDVFVKKSVDGGRTWSMMPSKFTARSNDDQWFPWLSVSPNGTVAVTYFDRRYHPSGKLIDTSLSQSVRGGRAFDTTRVSEVSWNPDLAFRLGFFIGDYNGLDTTRRTALPFWTDARFAELNRFPNNPPNQQSDVMVDVEPLRRP